MIEFKGALVSDEIIDKHFVCDLTKCKGACCVEGELGAPVEKEELKLNFTIRYSSILVLISFP